VDSAPHVPVYVEQLPDGQQVSDAVAVVTMAVASVPTLTVVPVAVDISAARELAVQAASVTDSVDSILTDTPESVITKVTVAARLSVADEVIAMPV